MYCVRASDGLSSSAPHSSRATPRPTSSASVHSRACRDQLLRIVVVQRSCAIRQPARHRRARQKSRGGFAASVLASSSTCRRDSAAPTPWSSIRIEWDVRRTSSSASSIARARMLPSSPRRGTRTYCRSQSMAAATRRRLATVIAPLDSARGYKLCASQQNTVYRLYNDTPESPPAPQTRACLPDAGDQAIPGLLRVLPVMRRPAPGAPAPGCPVRRSR